LTDEQYRSRYEQRGARDVLPSDQGAEGAGDQRPELDDAQLDLAVKYLLSQLAPAS